MAPVPGIVVSFLNADRSWDGIELLHTLTFIVYDWQLAHLASVSSAFAHHPASETDVLFVPLSAAVVKHNTKWLRSAMTSREVFDADGLR